MKITVTTEPTHPCLCLTWQMPRTEYPTTLYLRPDELTPKAWPHMVCDLSRIAVFWGNKLTHYEGTQDCDARHTRCQCDADVIYCDTFKLLGILRTLHKRQVRKTVIETDRLSTVKSWPEFTVGEMARHTNLIGREYLGKTLKHFRDGLNGGDRTFQDLKRDLSRLLTCAHVYAHGDEFYFDGRHLPNGCGYNGGVILHTRSNTYGIHT